MKYRLISILIVNDASLAYIAQVLLKDEHTVAKLHVNTSIIDDLDQTMLSFSSSYWTLLSSTKKPNASFRENAA